MQDPSSAFQPIKPSFPEQEQLKCPRCDSTNTKFCYYNNYNLSQPRHFCKNCRRYWTKGGALRNIPVGGGSRKNAKRTSNPKRANPDPNPDPVKPTRRVADSSSPTKSMSTTATQLAGNVNSGSGQDPTRVHVAEADMDRKILDMGGSFSSLLASSVQFGNIFEGLNSNGSDLKILQMGGFGKDSNAGSSREPGLDVQGSGNSNNGGSGESYLQSDWGNSSNGWPDLAIYTPGSSFQ